VAWTRADDSLPYPCFELRRYVHLVGGFDVGTAWIEQTYGGGHAKTSAHYPQNGARAGDFGYWPENIDYPGIARFLEPLAEGDDYIIEELFCSDIGLAWSHGAPSDFHDNAGHTHAALRRGAVLPWPTRRRDDDDR
jgi:hypothetical protein